MAPTPFDLWVAASGLRGPEAALDADPNRDRVPNGIAFVLGAASALDDANALLPIAELNGSNYEFVFRRPDSTASLHAVVEFGTELLSWTPAQNGMRGITIIVTEDHFGPGIDRITISLPTALAVDGALFARLVVTVP